MKVAPQYANEENGALRKISKERRFVGEHPRPKIFQRRQVRPIRPGKRALFCF
jgi:hypothetical protein